MATYKDLDVFKRAYELALKIYQLSLKLPKEMQYDLADQIRRASRSIPSNIAEGYGRNKSIKDKVNFLNSALGSNDEVIFNLNFLKDSRLISCNDFQDFYEEYTICGKQLNSLIKSLKNLKVNQLTKHAPVAQLVEQFPFKEVVPRSSRGGGTRETSLP